MTGADSLLFWILGILAVLLAGFSKAASGGGLAVLAVPLLSLIVPPPQAAAIMLPLLCLMDLLGIWTYRGKFDRSLLRELLPGALVGIGVGAWVFGVVEVRWLTSSPPSRQWLAARRSGKEGDSYRVQACT